MRPIRPSTDHDIVETRGHDIGRMGPWEGRVKQLVEFPLESGGIVLVEVEEREEAGTQRVGRLDEVVETSEKTFQAALGQICPAIDSMMETMQGLTSRPEEITVQFGIKFGAKAGAFLASADAEAQFTVSLKWKSPT
jgi:hypothetical protein